jgi:hypothetical protein
MREIFNDIRAVKLRLGGLTREDNAGFCWEITSGAGRDRVLAWSVRFITLGLSLGLDCPAFFFFLLFFLVNLISPVEGEKGV